MADAKVKKKGVVLFIVMISIIILIALANVLLSTILNQSRLTGHQSGRIQAYYAAMVGISVAYDRLFFNAWAVPAPGAHNEFVICREAGATKPAGTVCTWRDDTLPQTVPYILISVAGRNTAAYSVGTVNFPVCPNSVTYNACIFSYVNYTYTPTS